MIILNRYYLEKSVEQTGDVCYNDRSCQRGEYNMLDQVSIAQSIVKTYPVLDQICADSAVLIEHDFKNKWHQCRASHIFEDGSKLTFEEDKVVATPAPIISVE